MLKYGVDDIRLFYENDLRFLEQFPAVKVLALLAARVRRRPRHAERDRRARCRSAASPSKGSRPLPAATPCSTSRSPANRPDCMSMLGMAREVATAVSSCRCASAADRRCDGSRSAGPAERSTAGSADPDRRRHHREPGPVPALRRRRRRRHRRAVARLDAGAAAGRRRPPDQQHRRHHQLRAARARPADARVRHARLAGDADPRRTARAGETLKTLDGQTRDADAGHAGHRRRASGRSRSPASWAAPTPRSPARRRRSSSRARTSTRCRCAARARSSA